MFLRLISLALLLWGCASKEIRVDISSAECSNPHIKIINMMHNPLVIGRFEKSPITLQRGIGNYLKSALAKGVTSELALYIEDIKLFVKELKLYGVIKLKVNMKKEGHFSSKQIVVKDITRIENKMDVEKELKKMLDLSIKEIERLL